MIYVIEKLEFGWYLQVNFLYRMHRRWRKVLPTLTQRVNEMFNYSG